MRTIYFILCVAVLATCGCSKSTQQLDQKDESNQLVKQGQDYFQTKDYLNAEIALKKALEADPLLARPHLDLAMIYEQYKINYIYAIYHYDRYLELRPNTEKAALINEKRLASAKALAHTFINNSQEVRTLVSELQRFKAENSRLRQQLVMGKNKAPAPLPTPTVVSVSSPPVQKRTVTESVPKKAQPIPVKHQIYTVVAGDNLTKIAKKFYGNGNYECIYEANKDRMRSPGDLRVGQTLVIPSQVE